MEFQNLNLLKQQDQIDRQNKNKISVSICPMKSFSKTFNVPIDQRMLQNKEFLETLQEIAERQEEYMREKLLREQELENRVKMLEQAFVLEKFKKEQKIKEKLQKSEKNRLQFLEKIVKRCKDKQKFINDKIQNTTSKRKQSLKDAWKAAAKFNEKILQSKISRHKSFDKSNQHQKSQPGENMNKSLWINSGATNDENKLYVHNGGESLNHAQANLRSKNGLKAQNHVMQSSSFVIDNRLQKLNNPISIQLNSTERNCTTEENPQNSFFEKIRKTLIRHQENLQSEQNKKIQQIGETLDKINISRKKRDQLHKSRIKKSLGNSKINYEDDFYQRRAEKVNKKHNQRLKSESQSCNRTKRASDWSDVNRQRRQKFFEAHIQQGYQYLSENKVRYMKQLMTKNIAYNALEKKLYEERQKHEQN